MSRANEQIQEEKELDSQSSGKNESVLRAQTTQLILDEKVDVN